MKKQDKNQKIKPSKSKRIEIRVNEEFFQNLNSKRQDSGLSQSEFLRQSLSQGKVVVKKDYNNLATQVRKCGVNINEIAYVLNVANLKNALNNYDYQALLVELKLIQNQLNRIGA
ncbi:CopG family transcriptional regulator [Aliarcobacter butzleri]|uniref:ribbon-helix-helix domain-containing protein n=1 Tax=Aliarcobacter butzleri TaxID=28197 RepID=UPI0021B1FA37|nr:CopG family transcriptional regulator [Aliarcobacter butzleri]MCT7586614.1 ribbon-helix-helix domain-containing protein [Aliarcobacter butzleri]